MKYGTPRKEHDWVKVHIVTGTRTNCVTAAEIRDRDTNDAIVLPSLVKTTAERFTAGEVSGDVACATQSNFNAVDGVGATLYAAFKRTASGRSGGLYGKMFHLLAANRDEYLRHYHRRPQRGVREDGAPERVLPDLRDVRTQPDPADVAGRE